MFLLLARKIKINTINSILHSVVIFLTFSRLSVLLPYLDGQFMMYAGALFYILYNVGYVTRFSIWDAFSVFTDTAAAAN